MQVVDCEQQRALGGQVEREPVQAVQRGEGRVLLPRRARLRLEHRPRGRGGAGERGVGPRRDVGLEKLAHDPERELALELGRARGEHAQLPAGALPQVGEQAGLADPGRPLDQRQPPAPVARGGDQVVQRGDLALAVQEPGHASACGSSRRERTPSLR